MRKLKTIVGILIGIFMISLIGFIISIPIVNDSVAKKTAKRVKNIELDIRGH